MKYRSANSLWYVLYHAKLGLPIYLVSSQNDHQAQVIHFYNRKYCVVGVKEDAGHLVCLHDHQIGAHFKYTIQYMINHLATDTS